jgi:hypothetical protein
VTTFRRLRPILGERESAGFQGLVLQRGIERRQSCARGKVFHLTSLAERLLVPVPRRDDKTYWKESFTNEEFKVLTDVGISHLRDLIREENKKRRDEWIFWIELGIKFMTVLIGLAGAAIGVISIWKK